MMVKHVFPYFSHSEWKLLLLDWQGKPPLPFLFYQEGLDLETFFQEVDHKAESWSCNEAPKPQRRSKCRTQPSLLHFPFAKLLGCLMWVTSFDAWFATCMFQDCTDSQGTDVRTVNSPILTKLLNTEAILLNIQCLSFCVTSGLCHIQGKWWNYAEHKNHYIARIASLL